LSASAQPHAFRVQANADSISKRERELREVVYERNSLIHHWLAEVDFDSVDECQELISRLGAQDDRLKPHYESLMRQLGDTQTAQNELLRLLEVELKEPLQTETDNAWPSGDLRLVRHSDGGALHACNGGCEEETC